jgi:hypothetical protein
MNQSQTYRGSKKNYVGCMKDNALFPLATINFQLLKLFNVEVLK